MNQEVRDYRDRLYQEMMSMMTAADDLRDDGQTVLDIVSGCIDYAYRKNILELDHVFGVVNRVIEEDHREIMEGKAK